MIILYRSTPRIKEILDDLLSTGDYEDYSEIINLAIMNLSVLQEELEKGSDSILPLNRTRVHQVNKGSTQGRESGGASRREIQGSSSNYLKAEYSLRRLLGITNPPFELPKVAQAKDQIQQVPVNKWFFGQHNRLLPAKFSCRSIANLMVQTGEAISLDQYSPQIAEAATAFGDSLRNLDEHFGLNRDEALSTAFPSSGERKHKSVERYISQFIGQTTREGRLTGLLSDMNFIAKDAHSEDVVSLTDIGWQFALIENPVLDRPVNDLPETLSPEEKSFLKDHILRSLPIERNAFLTLLKCIRDGANSPSEMDEYLRASLDPKLLASMSDSFLSTQRSGAISRMIDLNLVKRVRDGIYVKYVSTEIGETFLEVEGEC